ncbi:Ldh family oxidoreductase [Lignipirellula cremea]|uniref:Putative oxidoreductase YbiC n=1 Tax=Lignipirellula cremea TaxID=2528010 RepID=A0A518DZJ7_9BACT|nr:Ldh family oxidoreductase [Lignipirellula cremea]QDU97270.1 putative oxidoreductase YbiC [Lignipirellula cremea]
MPSIPADVLRTFACQLLSAGGASAEEAEIVAASLVDSNLRGYDSHGVMRIPSYVQMLNDGVLISGAELAIESEGDSRVVGDANWGIGQVQASRLLDRLMEKSRACGVAIGTLLHAGHIGRLGEYCERAAAEGLVTMLMVNSHGAAVRVAPPGGKEPRLSTNPIAIGVPNGEEPLVLDFSTSATAEGKVRVKKIAGEQCPPGWLLDSEGRPTTDPNLLYGTPPGSILPMGGDQSYKGFGLSLMIDILCGALSGGVTARRDRYPKLGNCVFMMVLNPALFGGVDHFRNEVAQLVEYVRSCPTVAGVDQITLPGDPERRLFAARQETGLTLDSENWQQLVNLGEQLGLAAPSV